MFELRHPVRLILRRLSYLGGLVYGAVFGEQFSEVEGNQMTSHFILFDRSEKTLSEDMRMIGIVSFGRRDDLQRRLLGLLYAVRGEHCPSVKPFGREECTPSGFGQGHEIPDHRTVDT